jgi:hypothetical protein
MLDLTIIPQFAQVNSHPPWMTAPVLWAAISSLLLVIGTSYAYFYSSNDAKKIHRLKGFSVINAWTFFNKRYDFLRSNFDKTGQDLFSFKVLQVGSCLRSLFDFVMNNIIFLAPSCSDVW